MSDKNRETLKQYFLTGKTPTEGQFADLIDSAINLVDDSITCDPNGQVGVGTSAPGANLGIRGRLFTPLSGTLSVKKDTTAIIGTGTSFDFEIAAGDAIRIGQQSFKIASVTDATHAELATATTAAITSATAYRDANLLLIENGNGDPQFIIDKSGNVGIGIATPAARLHVGGKIIATELAGSGEGLTNLQASNLTGPVPLAQIPDLPAQKITGQLSPAQLPPAGGIIKGRLGKAITGTVSSGSKSNVITGVGTLFMRELNTGDALKLGDEIYTVMSIQDDLHLQLDREPVPAVSAAAACCDDDLIRLESGNSVLRVAVDKSGAVTWPLKDGQTATIGTGPGPGSDQTMILAAPAGYLGTTKADEWSLKWEHDGQVTVRGPLNANGDVSLSGSLEVGDPAGNAQLSIKGNVASPLTGTVTVLQTSPNVVGSGTKFIEELQVGSSIQFDGDIYRVISIEDGTKLTIDRTPSRDLKDVPAQTNGPLVLITDPTNANRFSIDASGDVVIGAASRYTKLTVEGGVFATELAGSGAGITGLKAASIEGTLSSTQIPALTAEQIPEIPSSKIVGQLKADQIPPLAPDQFPNLPASKIIGQLKPDQLPPLTVEEIPDLPASKLTGQLTIEQIPTLTAALLPDLPASKVTGQLKLDQIPALTAEQIPDLPASKITGQLKPDQIPGLTPSPTLDWIAQLKKALSVGSSGKIAIGPEAPTTELVVSKVAPSVLGPILTLMNGGGGQGAGAAIDFDGWRIDPGNSPTARVQSIDDGLWSSHLSIQTKNPGRAKNPLGERVRIGSNGNVGIGRIATTSKVEIAAQDGLKISGFQPFITLEDTNDKSKCAYIQSTSGDLNFIPDSFHKTNSAAMVIATDSGNVGIGVPHPGAKLEIKGTGSETVLSAGAASGSTCDVSLAGHVQLRQYGTSKQAYLQARDDSDPSAIGLVVRVQQAGEAGKERYFEAVTIDENGNIGIGVPPSDARLYVPGTLRADQIQGSGAGITGISAANINGVLAPAQLPSLDATKITGVLGMDQLPANIPASKIGQIPADQVPLLNSLIQRIQVLEEKLDITPIKGLRFDGVTTEIILSKCTYEQVQYRDATGGYANSPNSLVDLANTGVTWQAMVNPSTSEGEFPLLAYNYDGLLPNPYGGTKDSSVSSFALPGTAAAFKVSIRNGMLYFAIMAPTWNAGSPSSPTERAMATGVFVHPNQWSQVAFVWDYQTSAHLFLNGEEIGHLQCSTFVPSNMRWSFGRFGDLYFQGTMANIALWKGFRSPAAIKATPRRRFTDQEITEFQTQGLGGYWPLDEGTGNVAHDHTAVANHGNIIAPGW